MTDTKKTSKPVDVEAGKSYAWCRCGLSQASPLCDGSHQASPSVIQPLIFIAEATDKIFLCSCLRSEAAPYCDGINCD
ncbi:CDGSH iron-sulfur domain-containing protein [Methylosoma difficile]